MKKSSRSNALLIVTMICFIVIVMDYNLSNLSPGASRGSTSKNEQEKIGITVEQNLLINEDAADSRSNSDSDAVPSLRNVADDDTRYRCPVEFKQLNKKRKDIEMMLKISNETLTDEEYYGNILRTVKASCGDLCRYDPSSWTAPKSPSVKIKSVQAKFQCCKLFGEPLFDGSAVRWPPPTTIPKVMEADYTLNGDIKVEPQYYAQRYAQEESMFLKKWSLEYINKYIEKANKGILEGNYGVKYPEIFRNIVKKYNLAGKHVLVVGSESPWLEASLLSVDVGKITTLEYAKIKTPHPKIQTIVPDDFNKMYLNGSLDFYDAAFSFSSLEHSGLGRYGDVLNPWGDVISAAKIWCTVKSGGILALGLMSTRGRDALVWNAHREYDKIRWPLVLTNWEALEYYGSYQRIYVAKKNIY